MFTESIHPIQQNTRFDHNGETFHDILQHCLNNGDNSRSLKIEVTGILIPFDKFMSGRNYKFKLESESAEYTLSINKALEGVAKKLEWEEVTVKGLVDLYTSILEVEKISLHNTSDPIKNIPPSLDSYIEAEDYQKTISRRGLIEPSLDYLVS